MAKVQGVPVDDNGGEQVEAGDPVMLTLSRPVADFALTADAQGILQRMMCLALVETDLCTALHACVDYPFDDEQRPLDPAHLAQRGGTIVLARIGGELAQDAARRALSIGRASCRARACQYG